MVYLGARRRRDASYLADILNGRREGLPRGQKSHVNTSCKLLLRSHAFDTLGCKVVGTRNVSAAIEETMASTTTSPGLNDRARAEIWIGAGTCTSESARRVTTRTPALHDTYESAGVDTRSVLKQICLADRPISWAA